MSYDTFIDIIYDYWFGYKPDFERWFKSGSLYDTHIINKFKSILTAGENGFLEHWGNTKKGFISYIILMDQFSRHIYRDNNKSYKNDPTSLLFMRKYMGKYIDELSAIELLFTLMPFQHSENINDQIDGVYILELLLKSTTVKSEVAILNEALTHQKGHYEVIKKFNRFPKRNKFYSNRTNTKEEDSYIKSSKNVPY
jgi:uncharacterized protein (DUF924 family)